MVKSIPAIVRNDDGLYEGDLAHYFRAVFNHAQNLNNPYHNFRHMLHVTWLCYGACEFYRSALSPREMRDLLIAAMFHDFDHSGMMGNDDLNVARAIRGLEKCIAPEDRGRLEHIRSLIRATEYPHKTPTSSLELCAQVLRDADLSQALSVAWIQQVVFGLAREWNQKPIDVLRRQIEFHENLSFHTSWAKQAFPREESEEKIREVRELITILSDEPKIAVL